MAPSQPPPLRLLLALDSNFEQLAAVALCSFLLHNQLQQVVVITPQVTELQWLPNIAASFHTPLQHVPIPAEAACEQLPQAIRPYFYCIEAIDQVCHGSLANDPGRYLYIDADTLCIRELSELAQLPLQSAQPLAACSHGRPMHDRQLLLKLDSPYHYFNAGVLLFETAPLASHFSSQAVVDYYSSNQAICRFREQCALNGLLRGKLQFLPNQYNYLSWMRPRVADGPWQQLASNPMAYCLPDVRKQLAIVHLSAGAIPSRLPAERLEGVDHYWLALANRLRHPRDSWGLQELPTYAQHCLALPERQQ